MTINIRGLKESDSDQIVELAKSEHNESYYNLMKTDLRGTEPYIAPEVYNGYYCKATDMYGLGCVLYMIFTRRNINKLKKDLEYKPLYTIEESIEYLITETRYG